METDTIGERNIPQSDMTERDYEVRLLLVSKIFADEDFNCRGHITPMSVVELAKDIAKAGLHSPIIVQPYKEKHGYDWRCVAGYRRLTAFKLNQTEFIPCLIREGLSELEARKINLKENLIRKNLNVMEEARAIAPYVNAGFTEEDIAREFEQSRGWVQIRKLAIRLPKEIQEEVAVGLISQENIRRIALIHDKEEQFALVRKIKDALDKGERTKLEKPARQISSYDRKHRNAAEIHAMNQYLMRIIGPCLGTRLMAWAAGAISDLELDTDIRDYCTEEGIAYEPHAAIAHMVS